MQAASLQGESCSVWRRILRVFGLSVLSLMKEKQKSTCSILEQVLVDCDTI